MTGWPLERAELDSFYRSASRICEIDPPGFDLDALPAKGHPRTEYFDHYDQDFTTKNFRFSPPTRFGPRYRPELERSSVTTCLLDSTVTEIQTRNHRVTRFRVRSAGKEFFVRAPLFVLALGGIENARLLLHSDQEHRRGIGNHSDFVGRCFADHLGKTLGAVLASEELPYVHHQVNGTRVLPHLCVRDELLLEHQLINFGIVFRPTTRKQFLDSDYLQSPLFAQNWKGGPRSRFYRLLARFEPIPEPESRVTLSRERDRHGVRRVRLDWKIQGLEFESLKRILDLVARKMSAANPGRVVQTYRDNPEVRAGRWTYQSHHLGTTRMASDPRLGVVNPDGKVHSMQNLYIAGSSVFPAFGFANPTLTIVALTVRLARHLDARLAASR